MHTHIWGQSTVLWSHFSASTFTWDPRIDLRLSNLWTRNFSTEQSLQLCPHSMLYFSILIGLWTGSFPNGIFEHTLFWWVYIHPPPLHLSVPSSSLCPFVPNIPFPLYYLTCPIVLSNPLLKDPFHLMDPFLVSWCLLSLTPPRCMYLTVRSWYLHARENIQYMFFWVWVPLLHVIFSSSTHFFLKIS